MVFAYGYFGIFHEKWLKLTFWVANVLGVYHSLPFKWILFISRKCPNLGGDTYLSKLYFPEVSFKNFSLEFTFFLFLRNECQNAIVWFRITSSFFFSRKSCFDHEFEFKGIGFNIHDENLYHQFFFVFIFIFACRKTEINLKI